MPHPCAARAVGLVVALLLLTLAPPVARGADPQPIKPVGGDGQPLNLDFELGSLKDWTAAGDAFAQQPVKGDTVAPRRPGQRSNHQGDYWLGGYERVGDDATGTLTSAPFKVTHRWAAMRVAGGKWPQTRVEVVRADTKDVVFKASGVDSEILRPVVIDLDKHVGKDVFVRIVDERKGGWGHVNFDGFAFYSEKPTFKDEAPPPGAVAKAPPGPTDVLKHAGLKPEDAAKEMTLPPGFKATLFAGEPDVVNPIAFTIDARGRLWVVQGLTYPKRAPEGEGKDSIFVFDDTNNDGKFDKRHVFAEKLNLVSGIELGFGGVWVGAAPYLLFIPADVHADEPKPTAEPKVLLDGWGYQDTHETLNTFTWGPDGWLYGCHGVFTESNVGKPGTPKEQRVHINAGIWRYHPVRHVFERFAEGTSNPWGIDFDEHGQLFAEACVIPHLWHVIQGAHYQRQSGKHDSPYVFDDIKQSADHVHWAGGGSPHSGNNRSDSAGGGHAHAGLLIYQGDNWPAEYRGKIFINNIHGARLNMDVPEPRGSGFVGRHGKDFCLFNDRASQVINMKAGPDGGVYLIDWYDLNQCHHGRVEGHDRGTGRVFKITYGETKPGAPTNLASLGDTDLVDRLDDANAWNVRTASRLLQERAAAGKLDASVHGQLRKLLEQSPAERDRLAALWALHATGGLSGSLAVQTLLSPEMIQFGTGRVIHGKPYLAGWAIQLLCEDAAPSSTVIAQLARLARESMSPVVRLYLASAAQRLPAAARWDLVAGLLTHAEDAADHNLPLMCWYALEPLVAADPQRALPLALESELPNVLAFTARRMAATDDAKAMAALVDAVEKLDEHPRRIEILRGMNAALKGRRGVPMPPNWEPLAERLAVSANEQVRTESRALSVTFGSRTALRELRQTLADANANAAERSAAMESLLGARDPALAPILQGLLKDNALRAAALKGLAAYDDPKTPAAVLAAYGSLSAAEKKDALLTLSARASFAADLLAAVGTGAVPRADLTADVLRQLRNLNNPDVEQRLAKSFGVVRDTEKDKLDRIANVKRLVSASGVDLPSASASRGRALFVSVCQQCHTLFDEGGKVGPDITGSNRADLDYLLLHVVDPNAVIPNDYRASVLDTTDGRTLVGIVKRNDAQAVVIQTANETVTVPRNEVGKLRESPMSMMPEGLLDALKEGDVRDLVAYLRSPAQVPMAAPGAGATGGGSGAAASPAAPPPPATQPAILATKENARTLFNGRDLTGWWGEPGVFSVENNEIVGKTTTGLKRNEFLKSTLEVADFRLTFKMKLVPNKENSGVQFRSVPWKGHEMKGCQADAGAGWWGKLYEESGRGLLFPPKGANFSADQWVKADDWNTYEILAVGTKVRTAINGQLCTDLDDPQIARSGLIGLQVHSGGPTEVRWKEIELEVDPEFKLKTVK